MYNFYIKEKIFDMPETVTVKDLIEYLEKNFKSSDKLCFFDEGGAWCALVNIPEYLIGDWMFTYVKDKKEQDTEYYRQEDAEYIISHNFRNVTENDMVIY